MLETTPEVCAEVAPFVRSVITEARRNGVKFSDAALDYFAGMTYFAAGMRAVKSNPDHGPDASGDQNLTSVIMGSVTFSVPQAAKKLGVARQTLAARCKSGSVLAVKNAAGDYRITGETLDYLMGGTA